MAAGQRVKIDTPRLHGTISTVGARVDDLTLADYHVTPDRGSPEIVLLSPAGTSQPYFAEFGWVPAANTNQPVPGPTTQWSAPAEPLTPDRPVTLTWDNGQGLVFDKTFSVDQNYMFTVNAAVTQQHRRAGDALPYGLISRCGTPPTLGYYILHEGPIGVFDGTCRSPTTRIVKEDGKHRVREHRRLARHHRQVLAGVAGADQQDLTVKARFRHQRRGSDRYQVDYSRRRDHGGARPDRRDDRPPVRRRQGGRRCSTPIASSYGIPHVRPRDRLRLVLLPHQADLLRPATGSTACVGNSASRSWS